MATAVRLPKSIVIRDCLILLSLGANNLILWGLAWAVRTDGGVVPALPLCFGGILVNAFVFWAWLVVWSRTKARQPNSQPPPAGEC